MRAFARRFTPARMQRIAVVAPPDTLRDALVVVAGSGSVELDEPADSSGAPGQAARALQRMGAHPESAHGGAAVALDECQSGGWVHVKDGLEIGLVMWCLGS